MASLNHPSEEHDAASDFIRAASVLSRAIPKCLDDPEVVDALAYAISVFRYMVAVDSDIVHPASKFALEVERSILDAKLKG